MPHPDYLRELRDRFPGRAARAKSAPASIPAPAVERAICPRTGKAIPKAVHDERVLRNRKMNAAAQRRCRTKKRAAEQAETASLVGALDMPAPVRLTRDELQAERVALVRWLEIDGPTQRQIKLDRRKYLVARLVALAMRRELGMTPAAAEFALRIAKALGEPVSRHKAASILKALGRLEGEGGPWPATGVMTGNA